MPHCGLTCIRLVRTGFGVGPGPGPDRRSLRVSRPRGRGGACRNAHPFGGVARRVRTGPRNAGASLCRSPLRQQVSIRHRDNGGRHERLVHHHVDPVRQRGPTLGGRAAVWRQVRAAARPQSRIHRRTLSSGRARHLRSKRIKRVSGRVRQWPLSIRAPHRDRPLAAQRSPHLIPSALTAKAARMASRASLRNSSVMSARISVLPCQGLVAYVRMNSPSSAPKSRKW